MASARQPGPLSQVARPLAVDDGTACRQPSPTPGVLRGSAEWHFPASPRRAADAAVLRARATAGRLRPIRVRRPAVNALAARTRPAPPAPPVPVLKARAAVAVTDRVRSDVHDRLDAVQDAALLMHATSLDGEPDQDPAGALLVVALFQWANTAVGAVRKRQNMAVMSRAVAKEAAELKPGQEWHGWWVLVFDSKEEGQALPALEEAYFIPDGPIRTPHTGPGTFLEQGDDMTPPALLLPASDRRVHLIEREVIRKD